MRCFRRSPSSGGAGDVLLLSGDVPLLRHDTLRALVATHENDRQRQPS